MPNSQAEVLDPTTVSELRKAAESYGNPQFIRQLVEIYRTNAPKRVEQIHKAVAEQDAAALTLVAHTLKSNCSMLGATAMAQLCARLEGCGENATFDGTDAALAAIDAEFVRVLAALDRLVESA